MLLECFKGIEARKTTSRRNRGWNTMRMLSVVIVDKSFYALGCEFHVACEYFSCQSASGTDQAPGMFIQDSDTC